MSKTLYFVRCGKGGPIKIGWTNRLKSRFRRISQGIPDLAILEASLPGGRELELRLHRALHASRRRLEWFNPTKEVEAVLAVAKYRGLAAIERWLDAKEAAVELRPIAPPETDDFDADVRFLIKLAWQHAIGRHGVKKVAEAVGRSVDAIEHYAAGRSLCSAPTWLNLTVLDPGACMPFAARCGHIPAWMADGEVDTDEVRRNRATLEAARDAIDAQLNKLRPAA